MYNFILECYINGKVTDAKLDRYVIKGYITAEEKEQIIETKRKREEQIKYATEE